jgi:predicted Zn-dependent peptidase
MSYTIHFRAGNDYVKRPEIHQTAHIMEHMAFGPNEKYPTMEAFSQEFSRNGAYSNASTFDTNMHYYADCAQFEWKRILELQQLAITKPKFLPAILEAEKGNVREELTGQAHNNPRVMWQAINRAMGGHSLNDAEKLATIGAVTVDDIIEHHTRTHTTRNMRFVLAGNFEDGGDEALALLETWQLPKGERLKPSADILHSAPAVSIRRKEQENSNFGVVFTVPRRLEIPELVAFSALNHMLTGTLHSRIWGKARSAGICYGMGSGTSTDLDGSSSWEFYGQVRPDNADALYRLIKKELQRVLDGDISDEELDDTKQYLTGDYQMRGQTVSALAGWYSGDYFFDDTYDDINAAANHIAAIKKSDIVRLAREFIAAHTWASGEIGAVKKADTVRHHAILGDLFAVQ